MNEHVRKVVTERIEKLDEALERLDDDISWAQSSVEAYEASKSKVLDERVSLAKFLGVVF